MINIFLLQQPGSAPRGFNTNVVWQTIQSMGEAFLARLPYIAIGLIVLVLFVITGGILRRAVNTAGQRTLLDVTLADLLGRIASLSVIMLGLFVAAIIMFPGFKPGDLVTGLGITSVALGFAFKDVLQNFIAGILILWRRPFVVGDLIRTRDYEGTVEEIDVRSTRLLTADGERAVLPNGEVYANSVLVRTAYDKRRLRFTVGVGYPNSIDEAREVMLRVLRETEGVLDDPAPAAYVSELGSSSVNFSVLFWVDSKGSVLKISDSVATGIKNALEAEQIDMPFPHTVVLFHDVTGSRAGDINRAKHIGARFGAVKQDGDFIAASKSA